MTDQTMAEHAIEAPAKGGLRPGRVIVWVVVGAILIFIGLGLANAFSAPPEDGRKAPDFTMELYRDEGTFTLADYRGQVVVVNFWASWCGPCAEEAPALEQVWQEYKLRDVQFIGVDYVDAEKNALEYLDKWQITYPNGPDLRTEISDAFHIRGVPETFIVNADGDVVFYAARPITYAELTSEIEKALASTSDS